VRQSKNPASAGFFYGRLMIVPTLSVGTIKDQKIAAFGSSYITMAFFSR
jgi:hypothetical protein